MNGSSNVLVLGVTGQVGKRIATNLKKRKAHFSVGSRRRANLESWQTNSDHRDLSISMIHELSMRH